LAEKLSQAVSYPEGLGAEALVRDGMRISDAHLLGRYWRSQGASPSEIASNGDRLAWRIKTDNAGAMYRCVLFGLSGSGLTLAARFGPRDQEMRRGLTFQDALYKSLEGYRWFSWIKKADYSKDFRMMVKRERDSPVRLTQREALMAGMLERYLNRVSPRLRDPFMLGRIWPDAFVLAGVIAMLYVVLKSWFLAVPLLAVVGVNFAVLAYMPLEGIRYSYGVMPIYVGSMSLGLAFLLKRSNSQERVETV